MEVSGQVLVLLLSINLLGLKIHFFEPPVDHWMLPIVEMTPSLSGPPCKYVPVRA